MIAHFGDGLSFATVDYSYVGAAQEVRAELVGRLQAEEVNGRALITFQVRKGAVRDWVQIRSLVVAGIASKDPKDLRPLKMDGLWLDVLRHGASVFGTLPDALVDLVDLSEGFSERWLWLLNRADFDSYLFDGGEPLDALFQELQSRLP